MVIIAICMSIKHRFLNLKVLILKIHSNFGFPYDLSIYYDLINVKDIHHTDKYLKKCNIK